MSCAEIEILICDYVDGALAPALRATVDSHLAACPNCAALARDSAAAVAFMGRAADVEPPPELITRILFHGPWQKSRTGWLSRAFSAVLAPRFAMSMALTVLSFGFLWRPVRQLDPADLQPAKVWAGLEDRAYLFWARTVKFYDNLKFVYQIQTTLREWQQDQETQQSTTESDVPRNTPDEHRLPVNNQPAPGSKTPGGSQ